MNCVKNHMKVNESCKTIICKNDSCAPNEWETTVYESQGKRLCKMNHVENIS